jgi:catechol 2,3-dioxygenase-like lactoylglutathione lyase family enzyme
MMLLAATPALPVRDTANAVAFYRDRLGFAARHAEDDFAIVRRDDVEIHLWAANKPECPGAGPHLAGTASCRVRVGGLRVLHEELRDQGVVHPNGQWASRPWGDDDFTVLDLDGNAIAFFEPTAR